MNFGALQYSGSVEPRRHYVILIMMVQREQILGWCVCKGCMGTISTSVALTRKVSSRNA
jgi:hypothetical protein